KEKSIRDFIRTGVKRCLFFIIYRGIQKGYMGKTACRKNLFCCFKQGSGNYSEKIFYSCQKKIWWYNITCYIFCLSNAVDSGYAFDREKSRDIFAARKTVIRNLSAG